VNPANWPLLLIAPFVQWAISFVVLVIAFGLYDVFRSETPFRMRVSVASVVIASALLLVSGMNDCMRFFALGGDINAARASEKLVRTRCADW
jgi:hypothetical protein